MFSNISRAILIACTLLLGASGAYAEKMHGAKTKKGNM